MYFIQHSWHLLHRMNLHIIIYVDIYFFYECIYIHIYIHIIGSIILRFPWVYCNMSTEHVTSELQNTDLFLIGPVSHWTLPGLPSSLYRGIEKCLEHLCLETGSIARLGSRRNMNKNHFVVVWKHTNLFNCVEFICWIHGTLVLFLEFFHIFNSMRLTPPIRNMYFGGRALVLAAKLQGSLLLSWKNPRTGPSLLCAIDSGDGSPRASCLNNWVWSTHVHATIAEVDSSWLWIRIN